MPFNNRTDDDDDDSLDNSNNRKMPLFTLMNRQYLTTSVLMSSELREPLKAVTECFADGFHLIKEVQLIAAHTEVVKFRHPLPPCVFLLL